jgi:virulence-associated protein VagC
MKARVTEQGVVIPKKFLKGVKEVEIRQEGNVVVVVPKSKEDALSKFGRHPVPCNAPDASENLDEHLYSR